MQQPSLNNRRALAVLPLVLFLFSCASYNRQIANYYSLMAGSRYDKAYEALDGIKKLKAGRNELLYLFEKGKMAHMLGWYDTSNAYFNQADLFMEDVRNTGKDIVAGNLLNPMMQTYKGEDFEKFMVHYYKSLNYLYLGKPEEALVEARRISLKSYAQQDKAGNRSNRYSDDAFSLMLQGVIYEQAGNINDAFIAYRNAADIFLEHKGTYYGVDFPSQLQQDVLRTAVLSGFTDQRDRYEQLFGVSYNPAKPGDGGELVLFWENGLAPVKVQQDLFFTLNKGSGSDFFFTDPSGSMHIPIATGYQVDYGNLSAANIRSFHVALPRYQPQPVYFNRASVMMNQGIYNFEAAEDLNTLAAATLKERQLKELSQALTRLLIKKLAEAALRPKNDSAKNKEAREAMAMAMQVFNFVSEKADTRNWQSLPHTIYYTRLPLQKGNNSIALTLNSRNGDTTRIDLQVEGRGSLEVRNVCTPNTAGW